jgi:hypothetical protein
VLATPGLDRHAAYVALSRHREAVELHYGRDDFAGPDRLAATLSRERGKDMASDYGRGDVGHVPPSRASPAQAQPDLFGDEPAKASERTRKNLEQAVVRFARATREIVRMRTRNLAEHPHQRAAFDEARQALDAIRPDGARDLRAAFARDMGLVDEVAGGDAGAGLRAMDREQRYRTDPRLRAEAFVKRWRQLDRRAGMFERDWEHDKAASVRAAMTDMAKALHRDPQLESLLRNRTRELGLDMSRRGQGPIGHQLADWVAFGRGRGIGR